LETATNATEQIVKTVGKNTNETLELLSKVDLNDAFLLLSSYHQFSDEKKRRYQITCLAESDRKSWILDELYSFLERDTAKSVAFNLDTNELATALQKLGFLN
jgi:ABC-type ATPase with predicted acetyltransferase domain